MIRANNFATEEQIEQINEKVKMEVEDAVQFAEESPWPNNDELYKDIYVDENYPFITD